jgi:hypothetical protein
MFYFLVNPFLFHFLWDVKFVIIDIRIKEPRHFNYLETRIIKGKFALTSHLVLNYTHTSLIFQNKLYLLYALIQFNTLTGNFNEG